MAQPFSPKHSTNLQISNVIEALGQTEPDLFGEGNAVLMPVQYSDRLALVICDRSLGERINANSPPTTRVDGLSA
jgi:hypothetical protein